jgi:hypothetical protein
MSVLDIIEGHVNELVDMNKTVKDVRMEICKKCPLYKMSNLGPICNNRLYMNSEGEISTNPRPGYKRGCGCRLNAKTRLDRAVCAHGR